jgi:ribosomal protein S13
MQDRLPAAGMRLYALNWASLHGLDALSVQVPNGPAESRWRCDQTCQTCQTCQASSRVCEDGELNLLNVHFIARQILSTSLEMAADVRQAESLSDEQIEKLIQEAEARAVAKHDSLTTMEADGELSLQDDIPDISKRRAIPGLKHGLERSGYIQDAKGVAQVKRSLMVNEDTPVHDLRALPPAQVQKIKVCGSLSTCPQRY